MSHTSSRRRRKNHDRLLDAAAQEVAENGLDALSIKAVAARADYTPGALYRYFPSKDALLAAVLGRALAEVAEDLTTIAAADPLSRLVAQCRLYRDLSIDEPHTFALISSLVADSRTLVDHPPSLAAILEAVSSVQAQLLQALRAAVQAGQLDPGADADRALALFACTQGVLQLRKQEPRLPGLLNVDRLLDQTLSSLLRGWGASAADLDHAFSSPGASP